MPRGGGTGESGVVRLCLICRAAPLTQHEGNTTECGLQDTQQHLMAGEQQADGSIHYTCDVEVGESHAGGTLRFSGPYVHGTAAVSFLYLGWRRVGAARSSGIKRLKVPLPMHSWEQVRAVRDTAGGRLEAVVDGTGSGTVPLLGNGWTARTIAGTCTSTTR